jgi:hypothetical protein
VEETKRVTVTEATELMRTKYQNRLSVLESMPLGVRAGADVVILQMMILQLPTFHVAKHWTIADALFERIVSSIEQWIDREDSSIITSINELKDFLEAAKVVGGNRFATKQRGAIEEVMKDIMPVRSQGTGFFGGPPKQRYGAPE